MLKEKKLSKALNNVKDKAKSIGKKELKCGDNDPMAKAFSAAVAINAPVNGEGNLFASLLVSNELNVDKIYNLKKNKSSKEIKNEKNAAIVEEVKETTVGAKERIKQVIDDNIKDIEKIIEDNKHKPDNDVVQLNMYATEDNVMHVDTKPLDVEDPEIIRKLMYYAGKLIAGQVIDENEAEDFLYVVSTKESTDFLNKYGDKHNKENKEILEDLIEQKIDLIIQDQKHKDVYDKILENIDKINNELLNQTVTFDDAVNTDQNSLLLKPLLKRFAQKKQQLYEDSLVPLMSPMEDEEESDNDELPVEEIESEYAEVIEKSDDTPTEPSKTQTNNQNRNQHNNKRKKGGK